MENSLINYSFSFQTSPRATTTKEHQDFWLGKCVCLCVRAHMGLCLHFILFYLSNTPRLAFAY